MKRLVTCLLVVDILAASCPAGEVEIRTDDGGSLQMDIEAAVKRGQRFLRLRGTYRIRSGAKRYHLSVKDVENFVIDAAGAKFIFTDPTKGAIAFRKCRNVTARGLTVDYDPLPFTQGTVVKADPGGRWYDLKLDAGYPRELAYFAAGSCRCMVYDPKTRLLKPGTADFWSPRRIEEPKKGVFRLHWGGSRKLADQNVAPGDPMVLARSASLVISTSGSTGMSFEAVTVFAGPGIAFHESSGEGPNRYKKVAVTRGPAPKGATAPRLISTSTDGIHSSGMRKGPLVEDSLIEHQGDDGVAIHGKYALVLLGGKGSKVLISPEYGAPFHDGDRFRLVSGADYSIKAEAVARKVARLDRPALENDLAVKKLRHLYRDHRPEHRYFELELDRAIECSRGDLATSPDRVGGGFVVRNNRIRHHRARGLMIKAPGRIEGNHIEGSAQCGIAMGPGFSYWLESGYIKGLVVRNNTLKDVGLSTSMTAHRGTVLVGAISIFARTTGNKLPGVPGNQDIVIEGNRVENCGAAAVCVAVARNVSVRENRFVRTHARPCREAGRDRGFDPTAAVVIAASDGVKLEGNTVSEMGADGKKAVWVGLGARNVTGAAAGVKVLGAAAK